MIKNISFFFRQNIVFPLKKVFHFFPQLRCDSIFLTRSVSGHLFGRQQVGFHHLHLLLAHDPGGRGRLRHSCVRQRRRLRPPPRAQEHPVRLRRGLQRRERHQDRERVERVAGQVRLLRRHFVRGLAQHAPVFLFRLQGLNFFKYPFFNENIF